MFHSTTIFCVLNAYLVDISSATIGNESTNINLSITDLDEYRYLNGDAIIERYPDEPVTAQMFRAVRGRLRLVLDGGRRGICEETASEPGPAAQVRAGPRTPRAPRAPHPRPARRAAPATVRAPPTHRDRPTNPLRQAFSNIHDR